MSASLTPSATHRGIDFWKIFTWASLLLAGALYTVDPLELLSTPVVMPISFVTDELDPFAPAAIQVSVTSVAAATEDEGSQLFGMTTEPVGDGALLDERRRVRTAITRDLEVCRAVPGRQAMFRARTKANQAWRALVETPVHASA